MKVIKTYKYKLIPSKTQELRFKRWIGICRYVYNLALETRLYAWNSYRVSLSMYDIKKQLPDLKKEASWIKDVHSQTLQDVIIRMDLAYQSFFDGGGFPKWAKRSKFCSFAFTQGVRIDGNHIVLPKLGKIKFKNSRILIGDIKRTTIKEEADGFYICITHETEQCLKVPHENQVGIDLGIAHFVSTSDGKHYANPKLWHQYSAQLRIEQRSLARKKKGGRNWKKQVQHLAKMHQKVSRVRHDHQHKVASELVNGHGTIVVEDLKLSNMTRSAKGTIESPGKNVKAKSGLNRSLLDIAAGAFITKLEYKALWYGRELIKVDPKFTSQICHSCGHQSSGNRNKEKFACTGCGHIDHADVNAAKNILARAMANGSQRKAVA